ncbi:histamine H1 receptor [Gymnodraco acuticeps]|uniref:Muscarinic acetylcholine receptor n=1 Tax=Gymnodraco acuticeps TaxID=8218 RepID=A0A6P8VDW8_GYMAC|nr:histamine H1 receptor [Gymnodraco acuticeps]XP_034075154.1 histamine H1 receptor [Gymnodraco acuticeps]XP_034075155.1 histamine H1 receptor [Gymnodraco acuticeps]XP_034075156.1 histamine H1 receptor [Gymnodraco acuticeps]
MMESGLSPSTDPLHPNTLRYVNNSNSSWSGLLDAEDLRSNHTLTLHGRFHNALLGVSLGFLSLLTILMNLLVLYAVKKEKSLHTVGNLYIVSLSVADLIVGTTVMPLNLVYLLEDEWKLGRAVCQFWLIMDYVASTASIFSLFILCLDRYRSVRQPLKYLKYRTRGKATVMISGAWLLSMMWIIPILGWRSFSHVDLKPEEENKCDTDFRFVTWFKVVTAVFNFYVPSILMLWFYTHIYLAVRQHLRDRERIINPTDSFGENENGQNAQTPVKNDLELPKRECNVPMKLSKKHRLLDQNTLDQPYSLEDLERTKISLSRAHRKIGVKCQHTSLLAMTTKRFRMGKKVKGCSLSPEEKQSDTEIPLNQPAVPQDINCPEGNNENKIQASLNECHVTVTKSVSGVCDINQVSDVQRYTSGLYNNYDPNHTLPWTKEEAEDATLESANAVTLRQTWQRFIDQSRQRIQSLRIHKEHKAAKQLGFIIAAFLLCWIPYFIAFMVMAFCRECVHHDLHMFTIWLGYINSTLNPFIYPLCNGNFKRVFKSILNI